MYCNNNNPSLKKVSDILEHYYMRHGVNLYQKKRYSIFAMNIGLDWDAGLQKFSNLEDMIILYGDQVNDAAAYYVAGGAMEAGGSNLIGSGYFR